jgi:hypothetical protein
VFALGKSPVKVQPEILDIIILRELNVIYVDWRGDVSLRVVNWAVSSGKVAVVLIV